MECDHYPRSHTGAGCLVVLAVFVGWLLLVATGILATAIAVDALWHLGRWLLGW